MALILVDVVIVFGFPYPCLSLLTLLGLQNSYLPNERLFIALLLSQPLPLPAG